ncbi:MAG TPA: hypothetical protein V6D47_09865 [Oscillatoriaceae cyanobacterium]
MNEHEKPRHGDEDNTITVNEKGKENVTIIVNNVDRSIHRGHQTVAEIKRVGEVPPAHELEQVVNGVLTPLADDAAVTIKGDERFVSHPRTGTSS